MATLYVAEYAALEIQNGGIGPVPAAPKIASQAVSYTTATTVTLNVKTRYVRLYSTAAFHLEDDGTAATANEPKYAADTEYFLGVQGINGEGTAATFSVYDGSS